MLQQSVRDLDKACRGWWNGKGQLRPPRLKRRSNAQSIRICGKEFRTTDKGVRFPKIGELRLRWSRHLPVPPTSVTIIKDGRDRYFASFVVEVEDQPLPASSKAVGIDLGLTTAVQGCKPCPSGRYAKVCVAAGVPRQKTLVEPGQDGLGPLRARKREPT